MPFNLFRKKKHLENEAAAILPPEQELPIEPTDNNEKPIEEPATETEEQTTESSVINQDQKQEESTTSSVEQNKTETTEQQNKTYLKAMPLKELTDIEKVKSEVKNGNIIILRVTPLAGKNIENVKTAVNELFQFTETIGGDIARLGEERVVICPKNIRIWREKTPAPVSSEPLPTAA